MKSNRDIVRQVMLTKEWMTASEIARLSKLTPKQVETMLSAMVLRSKEVARNKTQGSYSLYRLIDRKVQKVGPKDLTLKLSYLRNLRERIRIEDRHMMDEIISDYEEYAK